MLLPWSRRACFLAFTLTSFSQAFYLPGSAPRDYIEGDKVDVLVNVLTPVIGPEAKLVRVHCPLGGFQLITIVLEISD